MQVSRAGWWLYMAMAACDGPSIAEEVGLDRAAVERRPTRPIADGPCDGDDGEMFGCPGMPCAHGWCAVGKCEGAEHDPRTGILVDAGVCCVDDECLAGIGGEEPPRRALSRGRGFVGFER